MSFQQPYLLLLLIILPLLGYGYGRVARGRSESFVWFPGLEISKQAASHVSWHRQAAVWLYLAAVGLALLSLAKPQAQLPVWDERAMVMLTIDVSFSMRADDIDPSRLAAAKSAAKVFVHELPKSMFVGLVSFAEEAHLESPLSRNREGLLMQIDNLEVRDSTAIGDALVKSLEVLKEKKGKSSATVVLLSDGRNRMGITPKEAAEKAKKMGVTVHTIGVGTNDPYASKLLPGADFDEAELKGIAETTGGQYYAVKSAEELKNVYRSLGRKVGMKIEPTEISGLFALIAGLLLASSLLMAQFARRVV